MSGDTVFDGLAYEDWLPLAWHGLEASPEPAELIRLNENNESLLKIIGVLEEYRPELGEEHDALAHELARLDFKLSLVLDLVGQILRHHERMPEPCWVKMSASGLEWVIHETPALLTHGIVSLYLQPHYPRPLELPAKVVLTQPLPQGMRVRVAFDGLSEFVEDALEKLIFRHHRRSIAHSRPARP